MQYNQKKTTVRKEEFYMRFLTRTIFNLAILIIGIFMVARYAGTSLPPLLSGIAFILIGLQLLMKK